MKDFNFYAVDHAALPAGWGWGLEPNPTTAAGFRGETFDHFLAGPDGQKFYCADGGSTVVVPDGAAIPETGLTKVED